mgnify:CR=1 FL=1
MAYTIDDFDRGQPDPWGVVYTPPATQGPGGTFHAPGQPPSGGFDPFNPGTWDWEGIYGNMAEMQLMGMREAIESQERMMHMALDLQWRMFEQQRADVKPWRDAGIKSLEWLDEALEKGAPYYKPPDIKDYEKSPYYDFLLSEGQKAQDRSAAARGMLLSGPQIKGTERFAQQTASLDVDSWLKRYYDKANFDISQYYQSLAPHQAMSGQGQAAAGTVLQQLVPGAPIVFAPLIARVDPTRCAGCGVCAAMCEFKAARLDPETAVSKVDDTRCRGCGTCAVACPSGAIQCQHDSDDALCQEIRGLCASTTGEGGA